MKSEVERAFERLYLACDAHDVDVVRAHESKALQPLVDRLRAALEHLVEHGHLAECDFFESEEYQCSCEDVLRIHYAPPESTVCPRCRKRWSGVHTCVIKEGGP